LVLLRGEKEILHFFVRLADECVPMLQATGSQLQSLLATGAYSGDAEVDKYVRQVVKPLVYSERPPQVPIRSAGAVDMREGAGSSILYRYEHGIHTSGM